MAVSDIRIHTTCIHFPPQTTTSTEQPIFNSLAHARQYLSFQLIIITGHPSSGKTHRASQLHAAFTSILATESAGHFPTTIPSTTPSPSTTTTSKPKSLAPQSQKYKLPAPISDHSLHLPRSLYASASTEKTLRATLYSAVKRALGPGQVVILDSGNYIKGWRYQLYCEAKAVGVRSCVVHVGVEGGVCRGWNEGRLLRVEGEIGGAEDRDGDEKKGEEHTGQGEQSSGEVSHAAAAVTAATATALTSLSLEENSTPASSEQHHHKQQPPPPTAPPNPGSQSQAPPQSQPQSQPQAEAPPTTTTTINGPLPTDPYSPSLHSELITRYEEPNAASRWDSPLYTVVHTDTVPPAERIWREVVLGLKADGKSVGEVRRNAATVLVCFLAFSNPSYFFHFPSHFFLFFSLTQSVVACPLSPLPPFPA